MQQCISLAQKGRGYVSPNPLVGAVLVFEDSVIGKGYHEKYGEAHAEVNCINSVAAADKELIAQATLYVNLEPCAHTGKTPPCVNAIIANKIKKVVIGCRDFSPKVNGNGIAILKANGVEVIEGVLYDECVELNKFFFTYNRLNRPYIILKWARTKDGFIAKSNRETLKVSNSIVDIQMHQLRSEVDAILVGYNTVLYDNPFLTARLVSGRNPIKIVWDKELSLPHTLNFFQDNTPIIIFNNHKNAVEGTIRYIAVQSVDAIVQKLYELNIISVIIEGGKKTIEHFIAGNYWDKVIEIHNNAKIGMGYAMPDFNNKGMYRSEIYGNNIIRFFNKPLEH